MPPVGGPAGAQKPPAETPQPAMASANQVRPPAPNKVIPGSAAPAPPSPAQPPAPGVVLTATPPPGPGAKKPFAKKTSPPAQSAAKSPAAPPKQPATAPKPTAPRPSPGLQPTPKQPPALAPAPAPTPTPTPPAAQPTPARATPTQPSAKLPAMATTAPPRPAPTLAPTLQGVPQQSTQQALPVGLPPLGSPFSNPGSLATPPTTQPMPPNLQPLAPQRPLGASKTLATAPKPAPLRGQPLLRAQTPTTPALLAPHPGTAPPPTTTAPSVPPIPGHLSTPPQPAPSTPSQPDNTLFATKGLQNKQPGAGPGQQPAAPFTPTATQTTQAQHPSFMPVGAAPPTQPPLLSATPLPAHLRNISTTSQQPPVGPPPPPTTRPALQPQTSVPAIAPSPVAQTPTPLPANPSGSSLPPLASRSRTSSASSTGKEQGDEVQQQTAPSQQKPGAGPKLAAVRTPSAKQTPSKANTSPSAQPTAFLIKQPSLPVGSSLTAMPLPATPTDTVPPALQTPSQAPQTPTKVTDSAHQAPSTGLPLQPVGSEGSDGRFAALEPQAPPGGPPLPAGAVPPHPSSAPVKVERGVTAQPGPTHTPLIPSTEDLKMGGSLPPQHPMQVPPPPNMPGGPPRAPVGGISPRPVGGVRGSPQNSPRPNILRKPRGSGGRSKMSGSAGPPTTMARPQMAQPPRGQMVPSTQAGPQGPMHGFPGPPLGPLIGYGSDPALPEPRLPPDAGSAYYPVSDAEMRDQYVMRMQQHMQPIGGPPMPRDAMSAARMPPAMPPHINGIDSTDSPRKKRRKQQVILSEEAYIPVPEVPVPVQPEPFQKHESEEEEIVKLPPGKRRRMTIYGGCPRTFFEPRDPTNPQAIENIPFHYLQPGTATWAEKPRLTLDEYRCIPGLPDRLRGTDLKMVLASCADPLLSSEHRCSTVMEKVVTLVKSIADTPPDMALAPDTANALTRLRQLAEDTSSKAQAVSGLTTATVKLADRILKHETVVRALLGANS